MSHIVSVFLLLIGNYRLTLFFYSLITSLLICIYTCDIIYCESFICQDNVLCIRLNKISDTLICYNHFVHILLTSKHIQDFLKKRKICKKRQLFDYYCDNGELIAERTLLQIERLPLANNFYRGLAMLFRLVRRNRATKALS